MRALFSPAFWTDTAERAIKTAAQAAVALLGADYVNLVDVNFAGVGSAAALAALVSLLTSVGSAQVGTDASPSLVSRN